MSIEDTLELLLKSKKQLLLEKNTCSGLCDVFFTIAENDTQYNTLLNILYENRPLLAKFKELFPGNYASNANFSYFIWKRGNYKARLNWLNKQITILKGQTW